MGLKAVIEAEADVPEALKEYYKKDDKEKGKFVLELDGIDDHPKVRGVVTANKENVRKRDELKTKVTELEEKIAIIPEGFDPEKYAEMVAALADDQEKDPDKKKKIADEHIQSMKAVYEKKIENLTKKSAAEKLEMQKQIDERDGYIDKTTVDGRLKDALLEVGVQPELLDGALASLKPSVKVNKTEKGDRIPVFTTDMGEIDVPVYVADWAGTKGKAYLGKPSGPGGRGNNGHQNGGKTMTRDDFNKLSPAEQMTKMTVDKIQLI
jgi:hypothetical protein